MLGVWPGGGIQPACPLPARSFRRKSLKQLWVWGLPEAASLSLPGSCPPCGPW